MSQMRVQAGSDYVAYVRRILDTTTTSTLPPAELFEGYDFRMFDSVSEMRAEIRRKDAAVGLSRLLAGYAWAWKTKTDKTLYDIEIDGCQLRWNSTQTDWIASPKSVDEVGSIHTVQGYDLNYAGVIIGPDLSKAGTWGMGASKTGSPARFICPRFESRYASTKRRRISRRNQLSPTLWSRPQTGYSRLLWFTCCVWTR